MFVDNKSKMIQSVELSKQSFAPTLALPWKVFKIERLLTGECIAHLCFVIAQLKVESAEEKKS